MSTTILVTRSYLVECVQTYQVEAPDDYEAMGFGDFDELVCSSGQFLAEHYETVDDDQLSHLTAPCTDELPCRCGEQTCARCGQA